MKPECWSCGSNDVRVVFAGYRTACCKKGCTEDHEHSEEIPHANMECRTCGNQWSDGSGDFADIAEGRA